MSEASDSKRKIEVNDLSKVYSIYPEGKSVGVWNGIKILSNFLLGDRSPLKPELREFTALRNIDLTIQDGESVAIVGRNGSGKSTLLQIISGTLIQSAGEVVVNGKVGALLQLGSGFNPEYTGRENVYLNAAILGLSKHEIDEKLEEILSFAEIGYFVDQPVKIYSSGMKIRLAFAVMTAVNPDILIVDEALSVGDAFFQSKCTRWLDSFIARGKTFICVAHDMYLIQRICKRGIVLNNGEIVLDSDVKSAADFYYALHSPKAKILNEDEIFQNKSEKIDFVRLPLIDTIRTGDQRVFVKSVYSYPPLHEIRESNDWIDLEIEGQSVESIERVGVGVGFRDRTGLLVGGYHTYYEAGQSKLLSLEAGQNFTIRIRIQLNLNPDNYLLMVGFAINRTDGDWIDIDCLWDCLRVEIQGERQHWGAASLPVDEFKVNFN